MKTYNFLARNVMAPTLDLLRGTKTMKCLRELEESQWWPRERIMELQNQRLRQLVMYAYDKVPYYHRIFDERGLTPKDIETSDDLVKLPVLTKQIIRANFDDLTVQAFPMKERVKLFTGGSTGEPLAFYSTRHDHVTLSFAARQRAYSCTGLEFGDKHTELTIKYPYRSTMEKFSQASVDFFRRRLHLDVQKMSADKMPRLYQQIKGFQPEFLRGYPSAIYQLARFIQSEGESGIRIKAIITGAEQLYDFQRELFGEVFGCDTYDNYGSQEEHLIAFECQQHSGYHIVSENVIVEVVNEDGKPAAPSRKGRIVITNLHNYAMPFIRYDIGDAGMRSDSTCSCGRCLPLLASLEGRDCDVIKTVSKGPVPGINLPWSFLAEWRIEQFQIVQETIDKVVVRVVPRDTDTQQHMAEFTQEVIRQYVPILGQDMDITVEAVEQIPLNSAGKRRFVLSNLPWRDGINY